MVHIAQVHHYDHATVVGNVSAILSDHGIQPDAELIVTGLNFVLLGVPINYVEAHYNALPEERHALSVLAGAITASLDGELELSDIRRRVRELESMRLVQC